MTPIAATHAALEAVAARRGASALAAALHGSPTNQPPSDRGASRGRKAGPDGPVSGTGGGISDGNGRPNTSGGRGRRTVGSVRQKKGMGQHFLVSRGVAERIVSAAGIRDGEAVFELGTGRGILTGLLCKRASRVVSVELDQELADGARTALSEFGNLQVVRGDGLGPAKGRNTADSHSTVSTSDCAVFVSNLPYSRSRRAVEQLASSCFERCIIMVQREFASKLLAGASPRGEKSRRAGDERGGPRARGRRRAISVVAQYCFEIRAIMDVPASCFEPRPGVDSVVLAMVRRRTLEGARISMINRIFSYRRKRVSTLVGMICGGGGDGGGVDDDSGHNGHGKDAGGRASGRRLHADGTHGEVRGGSDRPLRLDDLSVQDVVDLADSVLARV